MLKVSLHRYNYQEQEINISTVLVTNLQTSLEIHKVSYKYRFQFQDRIQNLTLHLPPIITVSPVFPCPAMTGSFED